MNNPLSEIQEQQVVQQAVTKLREYGATHLMTEKEADVPWQVGKSFGQVIQDYKAEYGAQWETQVSAIWGMYVRGVLRKWGYGENVLHVGNLNDYWMSFVKAAFNG